MNSISISGNVVKDGELKFLPNGDPLLVFSVADNMIGKDKGAIFWACSFFGKCGEAITDFVRKGQPVTIIGSVSERAYTDKDGIARKVMDVRVIDVALQGGKPQAEAPRPAARQTPARQAPQRASEFEDDGSDVPF
jgi:single-strand DNA-binding protein